MNNNKLVSKPNKGSVNTIVNCSGGCCPTIEHYPNNAENQQVGIVDDFGNESLMSIEQAQALFKNASAHPLFQ